MANSPVFESTCICWALLKRCTASSVSASTLWFALDRHMVSALSSTVSWASAWNNEQTNNRVTQKLTKPSDLQNIKSQTINNSIATEYMYCLFCAKKIVHLDSCWRLEISERIDMDDRRLDAWSVLAVSVKMKPYLRHTEVQNHLIKWFNKQF